MKVNKEALIVNLIIIAMAIGSCIGAYCLIN